MALLAGIVHHAGVGHLGEAPASQAEPAADVHVLDVQEVAFVEAADLVVGATVEQKEHAGQPVGVVAVVDGVQFLADQLARGVQLAGGVGQLAFGAVDPGGHQTPLRCAGQVLQQGREGVGVEPQVRVHHAEVGRAAVREGGVVIAAEALGGLVADHNQADVAHVQGGQIAFRDVGGVDDFRHVRGAQAQDVFQHAQGDVALAVADDGEGDLHGNLCGWATVIVTEGRR